jgi:hypothetical protein
MISRWFGRFTATGAGGATMGTDTSPVAVGLGASYPTIAPDVTVPGSFVSNTTTLAAGSHELAVVVRGAAAPTTTSPPVHNTEIKRDRFADARGGCVRAALLADPPRG